jgi:hypothetical protein
MLPETGVQSECRCSHSHSGVTSRRGTGVLFSSGWCLRAEPPSSLTDPGSASVSRPEGRRGAIGGTVEDALDGILARQLEEKFLVR